MFLVCATEERNCIGSELAVDSGRAAFVARNLIELQKSGSYLNSGRTSQKTPSLSVQSVSLSEKYARPLNLHCGSASVAVQMVNIVPNAL